MKKIILFTLFVLPLYVFSQQEVQKTPITTTELSNGVFRLFVNNAVAVVAYVGDDGVLLIDAAYERTANDLLEEIRQLSAMPIKFIINTHLHGDHTGGNLVLGKDVDIIAHQNVKEYIGKEQRFGERVIAAYPEFAQPNIIVNDSMELTFNNQALRIIHLPGGHTNSDIIIYFPESNVLAVGDLLFANYFPYVDVGNGGNPFKYLENIQWITNNFPDDVKIVGGHGQVFSMNEYIKYHKTLIETIEIIRLHKKNGMTLDEMKEERILKDWESWGKFFITEDWWLETIFPFV